MPKILVKSLGVEPVIIGETCDGYIDDSQKIGAFKREFAEVKEEVRQLVLFCLRDPKTSRELRSYLITDAKVRKLMENNEGYKVFCKGSDIIVEKGMVYTDESYQ